MMAALVRQARFVGGVCAGLAVGSAAAGAEYDWQVAGSYGQDDAAGIVDSSRWTLGGSYYPKPVDDTRGPYELAPFLTRSSYVTVGLSRAREEMVSVGYIGGEPGFIERIIELYSRYTAETSEWSVAGRYVWRESGWFAGGGVERGGTLKPVGPPQGGAAVPGRGGTSGQREWLHGKAGRSGGRGAAVFGRNAGVQPVRGVVPDARAGRAAQLREVETGCVRGRRRHRGVGRLAVTLNELGPEGEAFGRRRPGTLPDTFCLYMSDRKSGRFAFLDCVGNRQSNL